MKKKFSIKKNYQFKYIFLKGISESGKILKIIYLKNSKTNNRLGICVNKNIKTIPLKNKCKRLIRESFRHIFLKQGFDIVIVWRNTNTEYEYSEVLNDMQNIFRKLELLNEENNN